MVTIGCDEEGLPGLAHTATLCPPGRSGETRDDGTERMPAAPPSNLDFDFQSWIRDLEDELARGLPTREVGTTERAILVSVTAGRSREDHAIHLNELMELARSADVEVAGTLTQNRPRVDPKTVVGQGKLRDLIIQAFQKDVDLVIFDQDLTPTQARNLASRMELRVIDRTQLILDIFAQNATSRDGKLQVELAQLKYRLPHLAQRSDVSLSRLAGGIGGRGPGETKLEVDRRRVRSRITRLESELKKLGAQRMSRRQRRSRRNTPVLSIVGYTNAGKSTLLRALTHSDVAIADKMFATLDPVSRRLRFPREREVIITDTVGFIRDLPDDLVTAFQATLEELLDAAAFLHVVDASAPDFERHIEAVRQVLDEIGLAKTPEMLVFNQVDRLAPDEGAALARRHGGVPVSALQGTGLRELLEKTETLLWQEGLPSYEFDRIAGMGSEGGG
jgi:GTP-binding protein HflX